MTVNTEKIDFGALDYDDPCAVLAAMQPCYYQLMAGARAQTVTFEAGNGTIKTVIMHKTDVERLAALIAKLKTQCAAASGKRQRFAIRAGGRIL